MALPVELKAIVSTLRSGQSAELSGYPISEGDYDFSICGSILPLRRFPNWGFQIFFKFFLKILLPHLRLASTLTPHLPCFGSTHPPVDFAVTPSNERLCSLRKR